MASTRGVRVPMFVTLANFTDQGIRSYQDSPKRAQAFQDLVESMGGKVHSVHWTLGQYDLVAIVEVPDTEMAAAIAVKRQCQRSGWTRSKRSSKRLNDLKVSSEAGSGFA
ncbi:MAG: GYD domain-containing protein [Actinobacteria bacterium]|nr:GYD domain-containing protein [Actinomycetota bacterium]